LFLTIAGAVENSVVFLMFMRREKANTRTSILLASLAVSDWIMAVIGGTMYTITSFNHGWCFGEAGQ